MSTLNPHLSELRTLTLVEAAQATGIAERTLRHLVSTRRLPYLKVGRYLRFRPADLQAYLDEAMRPALTTEGKR